MWSIWLDDPRFTASFLSRSRPNRGSRKQEYSGRKSIQDARVFGMQKSWNAQAFVIHDGAEDVDLRLAVLEDLTSAQTILTSLVYRLHEAKVSSTRDVNSLQRHLFKIRGWSFTAARGTSIVSARVVPSSSSTTSRQISRAEMETSSTILLCWCTRPSSDCLLHLPPCTVRHFASWTDTKTMALVETHH